MSLFLTMLPIYLFGNLHCIGMCGPLVMLLGQHRYCYFYFLGRVLSFSLAGWVAGEIGAVFHLILSHYYIPAITSFTFGTVILLLGVYHLMGWHYPGYQFIVNRLSTTSKTLSLLLLKDQMWPTFLFGFFTLLLPCGQTLIVFSACALSADALTGLINGFAFALLTSPSLWLAMHMHNLFRRIKSYSNVIMGGCAILIGGLAFCRGLAEVNLIDHWVLNPESSIHHHVVIY